MRVPDGYHNPMGLLLTAIAVECIANGLKGLFPSLS